MNPTPRRGAGSFSWPPRVGGRPGPPALMSVQPLASPGEGALRRWWIEFEEAWFAPVSPPLRQRAREAGWSPDESGTYCDRCGQGVGSFELDEFGCAACRGRRLPWDRLVRLGTYDEPLSEWIAEAKFTKWRTLAVDLGLWLGEKILDAGLRDSAAAAGGQVVVVPVPTTFRRRMARGIDHAGLIARGVGIALGAPVCRALGRAHRPSQRDVPASQRRRNVAGSIWVKHPGAVRGRSVVLVDDVTTTGATLRTAARALGWSSHRAVMLWAGVLGVTAAAGRRDGGAAHDP